MHQAIALGLTDFKDAVQVASAIKLGLEAIVTRDLDGFTGSPIPVLSPKVIGLHLLSPLLGVLLNLKLEKFKQSLRKLPEKFFRSVIRNDF
ncbi:hypothetical protein [Nostoc sp.]|uniref:hypothetical protein n=1 Tax=Nostoc sp. TaxID=1180 RepID=UPI002FFBD38A